MHERRRGSAYYGSSRRASSAWRRHPSSRPRQATQNLRKVYDASIKPRFPSSSSFHSTIPCAEHCDPARGTKRKFDFDTSAVERLTREAEEAALRQIEHEQAEALRGKSPDFGCRPLHQHTRPVARLLHFQTGSCRRRVMAETLHTHLRT